MLFKNKGEEFYYTVIEDEADAMGKPTRASLLSRTSLSFVKRHLKNYFCGFDGELPEFVGLGVGTGLGNFEEYVVPLIKKIEGHFDKKIDLYGCDKQYIKESEILRNALTLLRRREIKMKLFYFNLLGEVSLKHALKQNFSFKKDPNIILLWTSKVLQYFHKTQLDGLLNIFQNVGYISIFMEPNWKSLKVEIEEKDFQWKDNVIKSEKLLALHERVMNTVINSIHLIAMNNNVTEDIRSLMTRHYEDFIEIKVPILMRMNPTQALASYYINMYFGVLASMAGIKLKEVRIWKKALSSMGEITVHMEKSIFIGASNGGNHG
jgi:hypothetical protein